MPRTATTTTIRPAAAEAAQFREAVRRWAKRWGVASLADAIVEWSPRLSRSAGRAYPQRMLIRLHLGIREPRYASLRREVLCHEAAHLAVFLLHGRNASQHGPEWRRLVELAGYEPRTGIHLPEFVLPEPPPVRFEHCCPRCHAKRFARRRQPSWRCYACRRAGLEGNLIIRPSPRGTRGAE